ncbi:hypothetical protein Hypma_001259 [Hypsizygus marmoreus]|uniref:F-box domain-containing protein n=1 Tax=Hypsizygus marmoreus TaxID=39966 RepID=A0A369JD89_HYPMA|nr:hypothetical protein Hypma_001259 [Hypsizygus marmoreus]
MTSIRFALDSIDDDVLVYIFSFLRPVDILSLRKTCRRLLAISKLRIVWTNACSTYILQKGYPFPSQSPDSLSVSELEQQTCHAFDLSSRWISGFTAPRRTLFIDATASTRVSQVRFVPGHAGDWILTVSKGIWDVLTVWDISGHPKKCCEWSPRGAIFSGISLNTDISSEATVAVSVLKDGNHTVEIMSLGVRADGSCSFLPIISLESFLKPIHLEGELLALSDDVSQTVIWDWRHGTAAILQHPPDETGSLPHDKCIQVIFAHLSILVVRARSIHLFPWPELTPTPKTYEPIQRHSFGWIDGVSVTKRKSGLTILLRGESDDPWSSGLHSLDFYTLEPNLNSQNPSPYTFPPTLVTRVPAVRGSLRCRDVFLGPCGTAVWVQPQDRAPVGLVAGMDDYPLQAISTTSVHESLVIAVFPGPLAPSDVSGNGAVTRSRTLCTNSLNNWTSLDYDEDLGRIALSSSFGRVMILEI